MALFSVAIPAYKGKYLSAAINSVLSQTVTDFELIIVNDASPDNITEIVQSFKDRRIRYYINETNIGGNDPVANWNKCLSYATGTFFSLLCDDDLYEPTFLESLFHLSLKYKQCNVFKSGVKVINHNNTEIYKYPVSPEWESCNDYIKNVAEQKRKQSISEWMFRREHILSCGGYEPVPLAWGADYLSIIKFSRIGGIASLKSELVTFRRSGLNLSAYGSRIEEKLLGVKIYTGKLDVIIKTDYQDCVQLHSCVSKIRNNCQNELIRLADFRTICRVWSNSNYYHVRKSLIHMNIIKLIVKKFLTIMKLR